MAPDAAERLPDPGQAVDGSGEQDRLLAGTLRGAECVSEEPFGIFEAYEFVFEFVEQFFLCITVVKKIAYPSSNFIGIYRSRNNSMQATNKSE